MIIPIRCFSCGALIADKFEEFVKRKDNERPKDVMDDLGVKRYCCRRMLLSNLDLIEEVIEFDEKSLKF